MSQQAKTTRSLVFSDVKAATDVETVLDYLGLLDGLTERGEELVGWCPVGTKKHGKKDSFAINPEKKAFQCFACKAKGSILDLVAAVQRLHIRDAADLVDQINNGNLIEVQETAANNEEKGEDDDPPPNSTGDTETRSKHNERRYSQSATAAENSQIRRRFARIREDLDDLEALVFQNLDQEDDHAS